MALWNRNGIWWLNITHNGRRIRKSTETRDKIQAQEYHDRVKESLWRQSKLGVKPAKTWMSAAVRWEKESQHKKSLYDDILKIKWLEKNVPSLKYTPLNCMDGDFVNEIMEIKSKEGVADATLNRYLALFNAILRKAEYKWKWIEKAPVLFFRKEMKKRIRWGTPMEMGRLLKELPEHLSVAAEFTLEEGPRASNVTGLKWPDINWHFKLFVIHADEAKNGKSIQVPLTERAIEILKSQIGKHPVYVFTYKGNPIKKFNTKAWRKALERAEIEDFRWHDLRHTWASWLAQRGVPLHIIQQWGGWSSYEMVLHYAHLATDNIRQFFDYVDVTKLSQVMKGDIKKAA